MSSSKKAEHIFATILRCINSAFIFSMPKRKWQNKLQKKISICVKNANLRQPFHKEALTCHYQAKRFRWHKSYLPTLANSWRSQWKSLAFVNIETSHRMWVGMRQLILIMTVLCGEFYCYLIGALITGQTSGNSVLLYYLHAVFLRTVGTVTGARGPSRVASFGDGYFGEIFEWDEIRNANIMSCVCWRWETMMKWIDTGFSIKNFHNDFSLFTF